MGQTTISWTATVLPDETVLPGYSFNPWMGCSKVSDGCRYCYAERDTKRQGIVWGPTGSRRRTSESYWKQPLSWYKKAVNAGVRRRVFCASLADVFEVRGGELDAWREDLWDLIEMTPYQYGPLISGLEWLLLTKRIENVEQMVPVKWLTKWPGHVRIGTTAENQEMADKRIPVLLSLTEKYHAPNFVSAEPLLGPVDFTRIMTGDSIGGIMIDSLLGEITSSETGCLIEDSYAHLHWIITGGESGSDRKMDLQWPRDINAQCRAAGVAYFYKQGGASNACAHDQKGGHFECFPDDLKVRQFPDAIQRP